MNITLLNVQHSTKSDKNGKPYQVAEVAFKNNSRGGELQGFKVTSYQGAYKDIANAQPGDVYDVKVEKKGQFNEWVSVQKAAPGSMSMPNSGTSMSSVPTTTANVSNRGGTTYGKDFETREERAKKQVYIVRQSAISSAIAALSVGAKSAPNSESILGLAKEFEAFVFAQQKVGGETGFDDVPTFDPSFNTDPQID